jgi:hypothetical protein
VNNREAAKTGDRRRALEVLRDTLAERLDTAQAEIHAQLAAQYRATLLEIEAMSSGEGVSPADDAASRVRLRLTNAESA